MNAALRDRFANSTTSAMLQAPVSLSQRHRHHCADRDQHQVSCPPHRNPSLEHSDIPAALTTLGLNGERSMVSLVFLIAGPQD